MKLHEYARYVLRYGVFAAGATAMGLFLISWLTGLQVLGSAVLLALVGLCIGPFFLGVNHTAAELTAATSNGGVVVDSGAGRMGSLSFIPGRERIGLFLVGLGLYGLLVTATILTLR